jgi:lysophospholipid acyltransferase (LPLAT)-like uncharacterized protein
MKTWLLGWLASMIIRVINLTPRVTHVRAENLDGTPQYILSFWHAHLLVMLYSRFRRPIVVMSSKSKDGELIARAFNFFDVECVRGSSSRGASGAMREMIRRTRKGRSIVFTPDGPTGPARVAKDGVVFAAQMTGLPIVPVAFGAAKKKISRRGTAWSSRIRSRGRSTSTASRSSCRVTTTSRRRA